MRSRGIIFAWPLGLLLLFREAGIPQIHLLSIEKFRFLGFIFVLANAGFEEWLSRATLNGTQVSYGLAE
jgi:hypothetical protein